MISVPSGSATQTLFFFNEFSNKLRQSLMCVSLELLAYPISLRQIIPHLIDCTVVDDLDATRIGTFFHALAIMLTYFPPVTCPTIVEHVIYLISRNLKMLGPRARLNDPFNVLI